MKKRHGMNNQNKNINMISTHFKSYSIFDVVTMMFYFLKNSSILFLISFLHNKRLKKFQFISYLDKPNTTDHD